MIAIESREELVSFLCEAAELEHGLCCSYLFAAFSLRGPQAKGLTVAQRSAIDRWRSIITEVAVEEMAHLTLVSNLLSSLGAAPHLRRPSFPQRSRFYPGDTTITLRRLDEDSLTTFLAVERPENSEIDADQAPSETAESDVPDTAPGALVAPSEQPDTVPPEAFMTVGQLYQTIENGFCELVDRLGTENVFIGPSRAQATADYFPFPELVAVTDLDSARRALELLVTQGEGTHNERTDAHYGKFLSVREELQELQRQDPAFDPAWPVLDNPTVAENVDGSTAQLVENSRTAAVMKLFNGCYQLMTDMLLRFFAHTDESEDQLQALAANAVSLMAAALGPLGLQLAAMPTSEGSGPTSEGSGASTAGGSFEFYRSPAILPHRRAAWLVFHERLTELAAFCERIQAQDGPEMLTAVAAEITRIADELAPHLDRRPTRASGLLPRE